MEITVDNVVQLLEDLNYTVKGGSDVWCWLISPKGKSVKVFYNDYNNPTEIIIRES